MQRRRQDDDDEAKYHIDLWSYCFIRRYFLIKFSRDARFNSPADMDEVITQAYIKVQDRRATVSDAGRYASWVSVVCKNVFLNYLRRVHHLVSIDEEAAPIAESDSQEPLHDVGMLYVARRTLANVFQFRSGTQVLFPVFVGFGLDFRQDRIGIRCCRLFVARRFRGIGFDVVGTIGLSVHAVTNSRISASGQHNGRRNQGWVDFGGLPENIKHRI